MDGEVDGGGLDDGASGGGGEVSGEEEAGGARVGDGAGGVSVRAAQKEGPGLKPL